ncbi:MAG TPA: hypothetical protein EYG27_09795 [Dehalococcoidia bacterium]|jgi:hypothetical protein|nr:hypothetical protein [Dehalococcoidia bacterium]HIL31808.1 hypothetical protein [Dehalococcoidia bacterium]
MDSSIIGKIEKAKQYSEQKDRVNITSFAATFKGNHDNYDVQFSDGAWRCECHFFATREICSHTMAMQRILDEMLTAQDQPVPAI